MSELAMDSVVEGSGVLITVVVSIGEVELGVIEVVINILSGEVATVVEVGVSEMGLSEEVSIDGVVALETVVAKVGTFEHGGSEMGRDHF